MAEKRVTLSERVRRALYVLSRGRCYAPGCAERVVVLNGDEPVFVGEIAHIVAASPGGPRGEEPIEDERRDSFSNLVLLCHSHHKIIDDEHTRHQYSSALLRSWKSDREISFEFEALDDLDRVKDLPSQLGDLLLVSYRETTAELMTAVERLAEAGHIAHGAARSLLVALNSVPRQGPQIGEGVPGSEAAFQDAYDAVGGPAQLGLPVGLAHQDGPGTVQHLRGSAGDDGPVVCALYDAPAVVVAGSVWAVIKSVGDPSFHGGVGGVGFPSPEGAGLTRYVGPAATEVAMAGGAWGSGRIVRLSPTTWIWRPGIQVVSETSMRSHATSGLDKMDLRLRLATCIQWVPTNLRFDTAGHRRARTAFTDPTAAELLRALAQTRLGAEQPYAWERATGSLARNDSWGITYSCDLPGPSGERCFESRATLTRPTLPLGTGFVMIVDARFDFGNLRPDAPANTVPADLRLSIAEVEQFFTNAWRLIVRTLPRALSENPHELKPAGLPRYEMYVMNERPANQGGPRELGLADLVDLGPLGVSSRDQVDELSVGMIAPVDDGEDIEHWVRLAMIRMAEDAGFIDLE